MCIKNRHLCESTSCGYNFVRITYGRGRSPAGDCRASRRPPRAAAGFGPSGVPANAGLAPRQRQARLCDVYRIVLFYATRQFLAAMAGNNGGRSGAASGEMFTQMLLPAAGYAYPGADVSGFDPLFQTGMKQADARLADPPPGEWEAPFRSERQVPAVLAHEDEDAPEDRTGEIRAALNGIAAAHVENGQTVKNADGNMIEHFGYVDGRSPPCFSNATWPKSPPGRSGTRLPARAWRCCGNPLGGNADGCGSHVVFRKPERNARGFKQREQDFGDALGLTGDAREWAGAMAVGRFKDGTPVVLHEEAVHNPNGDSRCDTGAFQNETAAISPTACSHRGHRAAAPAASTSGS